MFNDHTTIDVYPVSLTDLKCHLFKSWFYADVDFVINDTDVNVRGFEIMQRISLSLRAIAIMDYGDIDRHKLWQSVRPLLNHLLDNQWEIRVGDRDGNLCVRIYDAVSADQAGSVEFDVPNEGVRQLRNVDAWSSSWGFFN